MRILESGVGSLPEAEHQVAAPLGDEGLDIPVIGAPNLGEAPREDVDGKRDWWTG